MIYHNRGKLANHYITDVVQTMIWIINNVDMHEQRLKNITEGAIKNGQPRQSGNIDEEKHIKNTTRYVLDTTMCTQTEIT